MDSRASTPNHNTHKQKQNISPPSLLPWFFFYINLFVLIFGCVGSSLLRTGFSLVAESRGYSSLQCAGLSLRWLLLLQSTGSRCLGFSTCGTRAQQLWLGGLITPRHVGSSRPGLEPISPALAGRFLTTAPPGKSLLPCLISLDRLDILGFASAYLNYTIIFTKVRSCLLMALTMLSMTGLQSL